MNREQTLEAMRGVLALKRRSPKTAKVYLFWVARFIDFLPRCSQEDSREQKIGKFLTMLASREKVSASTQKQALCAIVFLYKNVLRLDVGDLSFLWLSRPKRLPEVFSRDEAWAVLDQLEGDGWLWGALMYGCGLRLFEVCQLRVKDISLDRKTITVRAGKGDKDRILPLPEMLVLPMEKHDTAVQKRIRRGIRAAKIQHPASCHTFRHSFATHWLENAEGSHELALKKLQDLMGHKDVRTTMIYLHLMKQPSDVKSPLDARPSVAA